MTSTQGRVRYPFLIIRDDLNERIHSDAKWITHDTDRDLVLVENPLCDVVVLGGCPNVVLFHLDPTFLPSTRWSNLEYGIISFLLW